NEARALAAAPADRQMEVHARGLHRFFVEDGRFEALRLCDLAGALGDGTRIQVIGRLVDRLARETDTFVDREAALEVSACRLRSEHGHALQGDVLLLLLAVVLGELVGAEAGSESYRAERARAIYAALCVEI